MAKIARRTPGFLPRDLVVLKHTAVLRALGRTHTTRRGEKEERTSTSFPCSTCQRFHSSYDLCWEDVEAALSLIRPSSLRDDEGYINGTPLAVVGYSTLKRQLRQIALSSLHFDASVTYGVTPPSGILLFGPPGCGKTAFVGWLAQETGVHFISVKGPEVFSKYLGETEARIRQLFRRAAQLAPSMLFFDEIEALGGARAFGEDVDSVGDVYRRTLSQLLNEMDGITERREVLVIGCTNRPDLLDAALIRPGRLERLVHVPLPDLEDRHAILTHYTHSMPLANDVDLLTLASQTTSLTGAELLALCRDAGLCALRQDLSANAVKAIHFSQGLERMRDRAPISSTGRLICERFAQQHGGIQ